MINNLTIIGVGLIGSSLAQALRQANYVDRITGCGRNEENLSRGIELGVIDDYFVDPARAVRDADVVVLAVPMGAMKAVLTAIRPALKSGAIVTDAGSTKGSVVADARGALGDSIDCFVPGHPIAGSENSGVEAGFPTLYRDRKVLLTPVDETNPEACKVVEEMWRQCGADVDYLSVQHHDEVLAATSHLPHMLAYSLVAYLADLEDYDEIFRYVAGGFMDFTRIASSDPVMWRDICIANGDALANFVEGYRDQLGEVAAAIRAGDANALMRLFQHAKDKRDELIGSRK